MNTLQSELEQFNSIQYAHHRVSFKLRHLQKRFLLDQLTLSDVQECCGRANVSYCLKEVVPVTQLDKLLATIYASIEAAIPHDKLMDAQAMALNWMLSAYRDMSDGGQIHAGTVRVWLCLFSGSKTVEKGKALFSLLSSSDKSGRVEMDTLSWLLSMCYKVILSGLGESLFPGDQTQKQYMEKLLLKCLEYVQSSKEASLRAWLNSLEFGRLLQSTPTAAPGLFWLGLWQNLPQCEQIRHNARCSICKEKAITGLCYECLQCPSVLCQNCHLIGRTSRKCKHIVTHRVREYQVPFKATNTWSSRLLCIAPHQPATHKLAHIMDDPVVPYFPHSNSSSTNISSSQSGSSIAESIGPSPTPSLPQKPSPVVYRINRSGSFQQADRWQQWNGTTQIRRTGTAPEANRSDSRGTFLTPELVPTIGQLDMDVDSYFKHCSKVSSHDSLSVTTTDTLDSIPERSSGDVVDHVPPIVVEQECGTENRAADVASQSSLTDSKSNEAILEDQVTKLTAQRHELSSELQGLIVQLQQLQQGIPLTNAPTSNSSPKRHTIAIPMTNQTTANSLLDHEIGQLLQLGSNSALS